MPRYVIHIGPPKTGSKYLQSLFYHSRKQLAKHGVCYPDVWWRRPDEIMHERFSHFLLDNARDEVLGPMHALNRSGCRVVLLSCEGFNNMSLPACQLLREGTEGHPVEIVSYCRRWSERIRSDWQQHVKMGEFPLLPDFLLKFLQDPAGLHSINYARIWDKWADVFGRNSLRIISHSNLRDQNVNTVQHFTRELLGFDEPLTARPGLIQTNESPNPHDTEITRALNWFDFQETGRARWNMRIKFFERRRELDTSRLESLMSRHMGNVTFDDGAVVFSDVWRELSAYADRLVTPELGSQMFLPQSRELAYVRPDYLFEPSARELLVALYDELRSMPSANPGLT